MNLKIIKKTRKFANDNYQLEINDFYKEIDSFVYSSDFIWIEMKYFNLLILFYFYFQLKTRLAHLKRNWRTNLKYIKRIALSLVLDEEKREAEYTAHKPLISFPNSSQPSFLFKSHYPSIKIQYILSSWRQTHRIRITLFQGMEKKSLRFETRWPFKGS